MRDVVICRYIYAGACKQARDGFDAQVGRGKSRKSWIRDGERAWQQQITDFGDEIVPCVPVDTPILSTNRLSCYFYLVYPYFHFPKNTIQFAQAKCHWFVVSSIIPSQPRRDRAEYPWSYCRFFAIDCISIVYIYAFYIFSSLVKNYTYYFEKSIIIQMKYKFKVTSIKWKNA